MALTTAQLAALKADILADPAFASVPDTADGAYAIAQVYNQLADPAFHVFKSVVTPEECRAAIIGGGGATQLDALTASKREALLWAVDAELDPRVANIRAALDDFCGSQNTLKAALKAVQYRSATRAEKLLAAGTGTTASPATATFEGDLQYQDVLSARRS